MNPANTSLKFSKKVSPFSLKKVVETACSHTVCDEMVDLLDAILVYSPLKRATAVEAMCHSVLTSSAVLNSSRSTSRCHRSSTSLPKKSRTNRLHSRSSLLEQTLNDVGAPAGT